MTFRSSERHDSLCGFVSDAAEGIMSFRAPKGHPPPSSAEDRRLDDRATMVRIKADDSSAFGGLVSQYWAPLVRYARRLLGDSDDAHDVVQEAFARLWAHRHEWDSSSSGTVQAYLYRLGRSIAIDELRRRRTRRAWASQPATDRTGPATPLQLFEQARLGEALERAIQSLPERRREVFVLASQHDLSHAEIGQILGTSVKTVANQMWAAVAELRKRLREEDCDL